MSDSSKDDTEDNDDIRAVVEDNVERQDSVEVSSQLSVNSAFTEDSLNTDHSEERRVVTTVRSSDNTRLRSGESVETSDTETDQVTTALMVTSPGSDHSSLERERQEDLEVFGLQPGMFSRYETDEPEEGEEFFFDSDLNLEANIDDNIVAAELLRPERLDTVEEVSEPPSDSINSLPHDGVRWPEQTSQHTSLSTDQLTSLNSLATEDDKEEMFSQAEMEFRNSFRSLERPNILRSQMSEDRSLSTRENLGKKVGLEPQELTYVRNPFEIFNKSETTQNR